MTDSQNNHQTPKQTRRVKTSRTFRERLMEKIAESDTRQWRPPRPEKPKVELPEDHGTPKAKNLSMKELLRNFEIALHAQRKSNKHMPFDFTVEDWRKALIYFKGCATCGRSRKEVGVLEMDHWIPRLHTECPGTIPQNIIPLCKSCNSSKSNNDGDKWVVKKFGNEKGKQIINRINAYFEIVRKLDQEDQIAP